MQRLAGLEITISDAMLAATLAERLADALESVGVEVDDASERRISIEITQTLIHPVPAFDCVIDYDRRLGVTPLRGRQSRAQNWDFEVACSEAVSAVVVDLLSDPDVRLFLAPIESASS